MTQIIGIALFIHAFQSFTSIARDLQIQWTWRENF